eukprot:gnl/MRDRNA2_/MRDRNA2_53071_c0_seq1.p1 gnl/MRDRNA2_/MRDRNA2_53071_c0~~gnl/MRDRNA2_/MRDRNA2_53071_c0_seq1.p1  ORF type:complete len:451 (+),score=96.76 gnl/MRDRNA2_/MRDRNA2_53071_c0_seq1:72-1355(+)
MADVADESPSPCKAKAPQSGKGTGKSSAAPPVPAMGCTAPPPVPAMGYSPGKSNHAKERLAKGFSRGHTAHVRLVKRAEPKQVTEEERLAKEAEMHKRNQEANEKARARSVHWRSIRPRKISDVPWKDVCQTMFVEGGSGGVLLVELADREAVCLKPQGMMAVSEFMAASVAKYLSVRVAEHRVLYWATEEYWDLSCALQNASTMVVGHETKVKSIITGTSGSGNALSREFVGIVEFVPGFGLMGIEAQQALSNPSHELLTALGELCALDVVLNNMDRMPLPLWQNEGNLSNIMVSEAAIVGIDQQVNAVVEGPGLDQYLKKLGDLIEDINTGGAKVTATVQQALLENCGVDLSQDKLRVIVTSLGEKLRQVAELWREGEIQQCLANAKVAATAVFGSATTEVGLSRLDFMCEFILRSCAKIGSGFS